MQMLLPCLRPLIGEIMDFLHRANLFVCRAKGISVSKSNSNHDLLDVESEQDFYSATDAAEVAPLNDENYPTLESSAHIVPENAHAFPSHSSTMNNSSKKRQRQLAAAALAAAQSQSLHGEKVFSYHLEITALIDRFCIGNRLWI